MINKKFIIYVALSFLILIVGILLFNHYYQKEEIEDSIINTININSNNLININKDIEKYLDDPLYCEIDTDCTSVATNYCCGFDIYNKHYKEVNNIKDYEGAICEMECDLYFTEEIRCINNQCTLVDIENEE